ncbi:MAG: hypothetical protein RMM16_12185, partial [Chloroherpetonaceae bacterium]|nr:hypothetical protein [Chloroherpetonaceae bacterium]
MILTLLSIALLLWAVFKLARLFQERGYLYLVRYERAWWLLGRKRRVRIPVGELRKTETGSFEVIDLTKPRLSADRILGEIYLKDGLGVARVRRTGKDIGYVDHDGNIFEGLGERAVKISSVSQEGERYWWQLWLIRNSLVDASKDSIEDETPDGWVTETGRLSAPKSPSSVTLLARAGLAFELLWKRQEAKSELPTESSVGILETIYCASLIYLILAQIPGFNQFFYFQYQLFPMLGRDLGYLANAAAIYVLILGAFWLAFQLIYDPKHPIFIFLRMLNRRTGIERLDLIALIVSLASIVVFYKTSFFLLPIAIAMAIGHAISLLNYEASAWKVTVPPLVVPDIPPFPDEAPAPEKSVERKFEWQLNAFGIYKNYATTILIDLLRLETLRKLNPFAKDEDWLYHYEEKIKAMVRTEDESREVSEIAKYIRTQTERDNLTALQEMQAILAFAQAPNIEYKLDEECEEIGNRREYHRYATETLHDKRGDCDCKAMLAVSLFRRLGYQVLFLSSLEAEHAAVAVQVDEKEFQAAQDIVP